MLRVSRLLLVFVHTFAGAWVIVNGPCSAEDFVNQRSS